MMSYDAFLTLPYAVAYQDDQIKSKFYVLPMALRYRLDERGLPVFRYVKYREPKPRADGTNGGGYLFFDSALSLLPDQRTAIIAALQDRVDALYHGSNQKPPAVELASITWTKGTASLNLSKVSTNFLESYDNPASPSLYGDLITPFTLELTTEGATLFEAFLTGGEGSVAVCYTLTCWVSCPPIKGRAWFHATAFYSFWQSIDVDENVWGQNSYQNKIRESFYNSQSLGVHLDPAPNVDQKVIDDVRDSLQRNLDQEVQQQLKEAAIQPVAAGDRGQVGGFDHTGRDIKISKVTDWNMSFNEGVAIPLDRNPENTLPNIETLKGPDGKLLKWADFSTTVDLNDPFFQTLWVNAQVNADFDKLPIFSVDLHLDYQGNVADYSFRAANDRQQFSQFLKNGIKKYKYNYTVNYKGESRTFKSGDLETDNTVLTLDIDSVGVLAVDIAPGDIRFDQVTTAQVTMHYEDVPNGVQPIEQTFTLTKDKTTARMQEMIFQPTRNPYTYQVLYLMANGQQFQTDWAQSRLPQLFVNMPFTSTQTIVIRAFGDLDNTIKNIYLDLKYVDPANNNYTQINSVVLSSQVPFINWSFPAISPTGGKVSFSGTIQRRDGTETAIPQQDATANSIDVGDLFDHKVDIVGDLIDWTLTKLVEVDLQYKDQSPTLVFRKDQMSNSCFFHALPTDASFSFQWQATYFQNDGSQKATPQTSSGKTTLILPMHVS